MVFPSRFLWGVSVSGFQLEMGDPSGKGLDLNTDWFVWVHDQSNIARGLVSGDLPETGVDYWNLYEKDHTIAKNLGLNAYRIGVEWSRIFPKSTHQVRVAIEKVSDGNISLVDVNEKALEELDTIAAREAVNHYRAVIEDLRAKGFKVFVCLNHFTLPLWVHNPITARETHLRKGPKGWADEETIVELTKYAAYLAWKLGDIVDNWATFNEPMVVPDAGYLSPDSGFPPGVRDLAAYGKVVLHTAIAHARAYDALKKTDTIKADEEGRYSAEVGLIHNMIPTAPLTQNKDDVKAADFMSYMHNHYIIESATSGYLDYSFAKKNREAKSYMRDRLDWLGVNYYTRSVVKGKPNFLARAIAGVPVVPETVEGYGYSCKPRSRSLDGLQTSDSGWEVYPPGIVESLNLVKGYGKPLYITEHGVADSDDSLRPRFIVEHLKLVDEMIEKKIDLRGYLHWSIMDNYEWAKGFNMKFGLYSVDLTTKKRTGRKSAEILKRIIENGEVSENIEKMP